MSRILIIEDEETIAELEKDYLELSGFDVEIENDGSIGLERSLKEDFDLFILDLMLPGTDGFEICRHIREKLTAALPDYDHIWEGEIDGTLSVYIGDGVLGAAVQVLD